MSKVKVTNGKETYEVDNNDLPSAVKDGYLPTERVIVANSKTKESYEIDPKDLPSALKDGFNFSDYAKKKVGGDESASATPSTYQPISKSGLSLDQINYIRNKTTGSTNSEQAQEKQRQLKDYLQLGRNRLQAVAPAQKRLSSDEVKQEAVKRLTAPENNILTTVVNPHDPIGAIHSALDQESNDVVGEDASSLSNPHVQNELAINSEMKKLAEDNAFHGGSDAAAFLERLKQQNNPDLLNTKTAKIAQQKVDHAKATNDLLNAYPIEEAALRKYNDLTGQTADQFSSKYNGLAGESVSKFLNDPDVLDRANHDPNFAKQYQIAKDNLYHHYPQAATKWVADEIGQQLENDGHNIIYNNPGTEDAQRAIAELQKKGQWTPQKQLVFEKYIKPTTDIPYADRMWGSNPIKSHTLINGLSQGLYDFGKGVGKSVDAIFPTHDPTQPEQDNQLNAENQQSLESSVVPTHTGTKVASNIGHLTGFLGGMALTGGLLSEAGLSKLTGESANNFLTFYGDNAEKAKQDHPDNKIAQSLQTALTTGIDVSLGHFLPVAKLTNALKGELSDEVANVLNKLSSKEINIDAAKQTLYGKISNIIGKAADVTGNIAKGNLKNATVMGAYNASHQMVDAIFGNQSAPSSMQEAVADNAKQFATNFLSSTLISAVGSVSPRTKGQTIRELVKEEPDKIEALVNGNPSYSDAQKQDILNNYTEGRKIYAEIEGKDLTQAQKDKYVVNALAEKIHQRKADQAVSSGAKKEPQAKASEAASVQDNILQGQDLAQEHENPANVPHETSTSPSVILPGEINRPEIATIAPKEPLVEEKSKGAKVILPQNNPAPNIVPTTSPNQAEAKTPDANSHYDDFEKQVMDDVKNVTSSSFDWRIDIGDLSQKDRERAVRDIQNGKDSVAAQKLKANIKQMHEDGYVYMNRGRGDHSESIQIPIKDYLKTVQETPTELHDHDIDHLNTLLGEDAFNHTFDEAYDHVINFDHDINSTHEGERQTAIGETQSTPTTEAEATKKPAGEKTITAQTNPEGNPEEIGTGKTTSIKNAVTKEERHQRGMDEVDVQGKRSFGQVWDKGKEMVHSGEIDPRALAAEISKKQRPLTPEESAALLYDRMRLSNAFDKKATEIKEARKEGDDTKLSILQSESNALMEAIKTNDEAARRSGYEQGLGLAVRKMITDQDYSLVNIMKKAEAVNGGKDLTQEQKDHFEQMKSELDAAHEKIKQYEQRLKDKSVQKQIDEIKKTKKEKKQQRDYDKEKKDIIDAIREKLRKSRGDTSATIVPYAKELFAIAPEVAKLTKVLVEQGIGKLEDLVDHIHDTLKDQIDGLTKKDVHDLVAGVYSKKPTRSELAEKVKELRDEAKLINELEGLQNGEVPKSSKEQKKRSDRIEALKQQISEYKKENFPKGKKELTDQQRLDNAKERVRQRMKEYDEMLKKGDFEKKEKRPPVSDAELMKLKADAERKKAQIDSEVEKIKFAAQGGLSKGLDYLHGWHRFSILSGIPTLGKIGGAVLGRNITTPVESAIGKGLSKIPGLSKIAKGAPREGDSSVKSEAKSFAQWVDKMTYKDVGNIMKTGLSDLDAVYGNKTEHYSPLPGWMDFFGRLHAAIKSIPKRQEFFRSLELRTEHALKNGADVSDPNVQMELTAGAYNDSLRAVFMQDNFITDAYKSGLNRLKNMKDRNGKPVDGAKAVSDVLQFLLPIVKVPTNFVAEESSYMVGALKAAFMLRKGIKNLSPDQKDAIMRAFKKQTIGAAFMMIGFMNPTTFGGYYTGKRKEEDLQAGDIELFGIKMPHWLMHTPLLEASQLGATMRRVRDSQQKKGKPVNPTTGMTEAFKGVISQVPFVNQAQGTSQAFENLDNAKKFFFRFAQGIAEPQLLQNVAKWTDKHDEDGNAVKRDPKTLVETLKTGVPGLREQVPQKGTGMKLSSDVKEYLKSKGSVGPSPSRMSQVEVKAPDGSIQKRSMTDEEYTKFSELRETYINKELKFLKEHGDYFMVKGEPTFVAGKKVTTEQLEKRVKEIETKASKEAKKKLGLSVEKDEDEQAAQTELSNLRKDYHDE
jgi:hypothetical protein